MSTRTRFTLLRDGVRDLCVCSLHTLHWRRRSFFFNFTATVAHRAQYAGKGALTLVHTLVSGGSDEAWTRSSPSTGHVYNIVLSLSKTMVNLSCTDASRQHLADWTAFYTTWRRFATHPVEAVRQRAATVASQVLRCPGTKRCIMVSMCVRARVLWCRSRVCTPACAAHLHSRCDPRIQRATTTTHRHHRDTAQ